MLSYQHAYHAGNPADLHKHLVLAGLLTMLTAKPRPITCMETHAGRGLYDLGSPEALKTGEAASGIGSVTGGDHPYFAVLDAIRARFGPSAYPGSPLIAQTLLRPDDRLHLMELHPQEHAALKASLTAANTAVHFRDGFEGVLALSPPRPRKGLVLVDPSYEVKTEYAETAAFARTLIARWPEASLLIWYPILPANRHRDLLAGLSPLKFRRDEVSFTQKDGRGMLGSGLVLVNGPHGCDDAFVQALGMAKGVLARR